MFTEDIEKIKNKLIVGNRYLVYFRVSYMRKSIYEIVVLEKATEHFKLKCFCSNAEDYIEWKKYDDIEVVEELGVFNILKNNNANNKWYETNDSESSLLNSPFKYYNN
jgi:hypothetical protein